MQVERALLRMLKAQLQTLSLREVEERTGVSFNTIGRWARRGRIQSRTLDRLKLLADWFGYEIQLIKKSDEDIMNRLPLRMRGGPDR